MTEEQPKIKTEQPRSKYVNMILVLLMGLLLFGGPYLVYILIDILEIGYLVSTVLGFGMVVAGLLLMWYLIKTKVIS